MAAMESGLTLSAAQFGKLLAAMDTARDSWWPEISVFVSAFLAMLVGILLERYKNYRDKMKADEEKKTAEVQQIDTAIVAIAYNVERLLHAAAQNMLPHFEQSHRAYDDLHNALSENNLMNAFCNSMPTSYPAMMRTCPNLYFKELDFSKDLKFIVAKDITLAKRSGWLVAFTNELEKIIDARNVNIQDTHRLFLMPVDFHQLRAMIQLQVAISDTECVLASQLFEQLRQMVESLETVRRTYKGAAKGIARTVHVEFPPDLETTMKHLKEIAEKTKVVG